ncbi:MAG: hypothetical protein K2X03_06025 [Bryobacteraceae bacterium]|nr:hypothetical protein [Bryobacteraceae bacterium]
MFAEGGLRFEMRIINLHDFEAEEILDSPDPADLVWAIGARGDHAQALPRILQRYAALRSEDQRVAISHLCTYAAMMGLDGLLNESLKEFPMITANLEESAIGRALMEKGLEKGTQDLLLDLLSTKFGSLPDWATERVKQAPLDTLKRWAHRFVRANSLEETLD